MRMKPVLTSEDVLKIVAAAKAHCEAIKRPGTIAVVDEAGHLLHLERHDTVDVNSVEIATLKARCAAFRRRPTAAFAERVKEKPGFLMMPNYLGVEGGVPLMHQGECVGGIAVSGIDVDDEPVAKAGAQAFES